MPVEDRRRPLRVAVLGGTGFLGRALGTALTDQGHEVLAVARHAPADPVAGALRLLDLSTASAAEIAERLSPVDAIVNAAGGMWGLTEEQMVAANTLLVDRVIEATRLMPGRPRLVQIGSVHEYGLVPIGESMSEDGPANPVMHYGALKLACTEAVSAATRAGEIDGVTLRIGNVVGAGQPAVSLLGVVAAQLATASAEERTAELLLGPLGSQRDFVGLSDAIAAIVASLTAPLDGATVINVGRGVASTARDLVQALIEVSGVPATLTEKVAEGPAETGWQQLEIGVARRVLHWTPAEDLLDDVKQLWAAYSPGGLS
jgi:nucleoside-diphosphate-sugar epimerase